MSLLAELNELQKSSDGELAQLLSLIIQELVRLYDLEKDALDLATAILDRGKTVNLEAAKRVIEKGRFIKV